MNALWLLAAHLVGDFLFQSRSQAQLKLTSPRVRAYHVGCYSLAFVPVALVAAGWSWQAAAFLAANAAAHFAIDSHRFQSTLADVLEWQAFRHAHPGEATKTWVEYLYGGETNMRLGDRITRTNDISRGVVRWPPPNPWHPIGILMDQSLHIVVLAALGSLLLT